MEGEGWKFDGGKEQRNLLSAEARAWWNKWKGNFTILQMLQVLMERFSY
jgi:hypothetical protein